MNRIAICLLATIICCAATQVTAATVIVPAPSSVVASSEYSGAYAVTNLFDATVTPADIGARNKRQPGNKWKR